MKPRLSYLSWELVKHETLKCFAHSFTSCRCCLDKVKDDHLYFAVEQLELDWSKILFSTFGVVRCVSAWAALTQFGPFISMSDGPLSVTRYIQILNDIVLPFLVKNNIFIWLPVQTFHLYLRSRIKLKHRPFLV